MNGCTFGFHKWGRWTVSPQFDHVRILPRHNMQIESELLERDCSRCGKHEERAGAIRQVRRAV